MCVDSATTQVGELARLVGAVGGTVSSSGHLSREIKEATMARFWSNKAYLCNLHVYPLDETDNQPESLVDTRTEWCFAKRKTAVIHL
jgi:hypothetical protein